MSYKLIQKELRKFAQKEKAEFFPYFFKTEDGQYGAGDMFIGVTVPNSRKVAKLFSQTPLSEIEKLLSSKIHEDRLVALLILVNQFEKGGEAIQTKIYNFYLKNTKYINNWDLVDLSAYKIVGKYLLDKPKEILTKLAKSSSIWERRIAIISTFWFIKNNQFEPTLNIADLLVDDKQDLIHKAVGWMLREVGNRDKDVEVKFLHKHYKTMPRTMLRYAIEKFDHQERLNYLQGRI